MRIFGSERRERGDFFMQMRRGVAHFLTIRGTAVFFKHMCLN